MPKSYFSAIQLIQASLSIILQYLLIQSKCMDLSQFQLPPCCYSEVPFLDQAASSQSVVTITSQGSMNSTSDQVLISDPAHPNVTTENGSIHRFTYPMEFFEVSSNGSRGLEDRSVLDQTINSTESGVNISAANQSEVNSSIPDGDSSTSNLIEAEIHHTDHSTSFKMPSTWELYLRRALYQSMSVNSTLQHIASRSTDGEEVESELWQNIRDAKLQVIDPSTRKPTTNRIPELELTTHRISGVMVNTKDGVELRASASNFPGIPGQPCDCHLINHGDALLAYWSVGHGHSGPDSSIEYLVYPVPHNIPTPPIFQPFHTDKGIRPSPIDLNPSIQSDDYSREQPFQPSLDVGIQTPKLEFEQQLVGLKNEILSNSNPQRHGLGQSSNFNGVPVLPPQGQGPYPQFHHHVVEHFGIYPGPGNGIQPYNSYPPFQQLHPEQLKELEFVRHFRKLIPIGELPQGPPSVPLPPPNSIQEIITNQGPFPGEPPFILPPRCRPQGSDGGSYPISECRPDFDRPRPDPGSGRPRPGDPDYGRYPGDPDYRPRPGDPDFGRYPGDPSFTPRPGDPDYGRYPGDPSYRPRPGDPDYGRYPGDRDPNYRPRPSDPDYGRYPGDSNYRPRPGDPDYGRYPGDSDYRPSPPRDPNGDRYPESPDYRPYSQNGLQVKGPKTTYNNDDRYGTSYSPPKVKYSMGAGSRSGKIRFQDSGYPVSASTLKKREQKLYANSRKESSYMLKF